MAKYGKNRGKVDLMTVFLTVYFKSEIMQPLFIKAYSEFLDTYRSQRNDEFLN